VKVPVDTTALITNEGVILVDEKFEIDADNSFAKADRVAPSNLKKCSAPVERRLLSAPVFAVSFA
jgi:hypothetical protein